MRKITVGDLLDMLIGTHKVLITYNGKTIEYQSQADVPKDWYDRYVANIVCGINLLSISICDGNNTLKEGEQKIMNPNTDVEINQFNLSFRNAYFQMLNGKHVALPAWSGYWAWENNTIMMHCNDGKVIDIRETNNPAYTFGNIAENNWGVVDR